MVHVATVRNGELCGQSARLAIIDEQRCFMMRMISGACGAEMLVTTAAYALLLEPLVRTSSSNAIAWLVRTSDIGYNTESVLHC